MDAYRKGVETSIFINEAKFHKEKLTAPETEIYHAAFPDFDGTEDVVSTKRITEFESLAGKNIAWAYFSNNWYDSIQFPKKAFKTISEAGKVPFIRIMARTNFDGEGPDPNYTMQRIIDGDFEVALKQWAIDASETKLPFLAEFGTEVNGKWFPWNGLYNGAGTKNGYGDPNLADGPERFRDAYRHIIELYNANGACSIT